MVALSHKMSEAILKSLIVPLSLVKLQDAPFSMFSGILNLEWVVLPPGMMEAVTPDVTLANAMIKSLSKSTLIYLLLSII
jgi:hypothetical protein